MKKTIKTLCFVICCQLTAVPAPAGESVFGEETGYRRATLAESFTREEAGRKRVAVVLSGGGTRGMAHIGVLKALEEQDIPIDYIAGTSIGAIIGGMYAAGYSPAEIEELVLSREFADASVGRIDDAYRQSHLEPRPDPSWVNLYFGWEDRLEPQNILRQNIPTNIVSPYLMDFLFMEYLGPASAAANFHFDNLFIPFRCIVTEVESRRGITMRDGSLPDAVRASMTFPFYFQPVEIDGKLMMDGGMFNNFPADVVHKEFQPDVVIGSVVSGNPAPPRRDDIVSQLENLLMHPSTYDILTDQGVLITPSVPDIAINDMSRNAEIIGNGYVAAMEQMDDIKSFINIFEDRQERERRRRAFRFSIPDPIVGSIQVRGLNEDQTDFVLESLAHENLPTSFEELKKRYLGLLLNNRFDYVYPYLRYDNTTGFFIFSLEMEKRRELLRSFGGNISSRQVNHIFGKFEYARWASRPLTLTSKMHLGNFYNSACVSARLDFPGTAPIYLAAKGQVSFWEYARSSVFLLEEQESPFLKQREIKTRLAMGYPIDNDKKVEFGGSFVAARDNFFNTRNFREADTMDVVTFRPWVMYASFEQNSLNRKQYPTKGSFLHTSFRIVRGQESYTPGSTAIQTSPGENTRAWVEALFQYKRFLLPRSRFNPGLSAEVFFSQRPVFSNYTATIAMARQYNPFPVASTIYMPGFRANTYLAGGLKSIYNLSANASIQSELHLYQPLQTIRGTPTQQAIIEEYSFRPRPMGNLALVYHTAPGPLSVSMSYFHNEQESWVFMINFGFILFNKQAFM